MARRRPAKESPRVHAGGVTVTVRVVHDGDWVRPGGGARVAVHLAQALDAPLTVGHSDRPEWYRDRVDGVEIAFNSELHDSLTARIIDRPALRPLAELRLGQLINGLAFDEDIIVSTGTAAKWFAPKAGQTNIHYCHSPPPRCYAESSGLFDAGTGIIDSHFARLTDRFLANSEFTRARVGKHYRRTADILHPPVRTHAFEYDEPASPPMFVMIGRLVEMKRPRMVVDAFRDLDARLVLVGDGPLRHACASVPGVEVRPDASDREVETLVADAVGGIAFAEQEHCGLTPKEIQAAGKPVIVPDEPNLHNHVTDGETGVIVPATITGVQDGVRRVLERDWDHHRIQSAASAWSIDSFHERARHLILDNTDSTQDTDTGPRQSPSDTHQEAHSHA